MPCHFIVSIQTFNIFNSTVNSSHALSEKFHSDLYQFIWQRLWLLHKSLGYYQHFFSLFSENIHSNYTSSEVFSNSIISALSDEDILRQKMREPVDWSLVAHRPPIITPIKEIDCHIDRNTRTAHTSFVSYQSNWIKGRCLIMIFFSSRAFHYHYDSLRFHIWFLPQNK